MKVVQNFHAVFVTSHELPHQVVELWIFAEKGLVFSLLLVHKVFYVHIKAGRRDAFRSLCGLLTFLKQQRQQGEQWMSEETERERETIYYIYFIFSIAYVLLNCLWCASFNSVLQPNFILRQ